MNKPAKLVYAIAPCPRIDFGSRRLFSEEASKILVFVIINSMMKKHFFLTQLEFKAEVDSA